MALGPEELAADAEELCLDGLNECCGSCVGSGEMFCVRVRSLALIENDAGTCAVGFSSNFEEVAGVAKVESALARIRLCLTVDAEADEGRMGVVDTFGGMLILSSTDDGVMGFIVTGLEGAFVNGVFSGIE